jgi:CubicO group peptidase (beta-lactamase class C family)
MFMTAGALAARVAGMESWEALTQALILDPLGMHNANFSVHVSEDADNAAQPYLSVGDKYQRVPFRNLDHIGPAGSINANLIDMAPWLLMHLNGGMHNGRSLIRPETLREMHTPQIVMPIPPESPWQTYPVVAQPSYGLGWAGQTYRGRTMIRHNGGIDGFIAIVSFLPHEGIGTIILTNSGSDLPATAIHCQLYDRLLGTERPDWNERFKGHAARLKAAADKAKAEMLSRQIPGTHPSHPLGAYEGVFTHPGYGDLSVTREGERLRFIYNGLHFEGTHHHYDVFRIANEAIEVFAPCTFVTDLNGEIGSIEAPLEPSVAPIVFTRKIAPGA